MYGRKGVAEGGKRKGRPVKETPLKQILNGVIEEPKNPVAAPYTVEKLNLRP